MKPEASQGVHSELFADRNDDEFAAHKQNTKAPNRTGFPKAALLLVDALKKNRACQKFIRRKLINIEAKIEENKDLGDRVKCLLGYQLSCRRSASRTLSQKEDPRVRLISSRKPTRLSEKVLPSVYTSMRWMLPDAHYCIRIYKTLPSIVVPNYYSSSKIYPW
jgi:transcription factor MYB, plant